MQVSQRKEDWNKIQFFNSIFRMCNFKKPSTKEEEVMRFQKMPAVSFILCFALVLGIGYAGTALASDTTKAGEPSDWKFHDIADLALIQQYAKLPQPEGVMIIDSRPYKPKYAKGHIPMAISIPHSQFDKMTDKLPADKKALLIFYCGGPT
jgi:hypothetical protein